MSSVLREKFAVELPLAILHGVIDGVPVLIELAKLIVGEVVGGAGEHLVAEGLEGHVEVIHACIIPQVRGDVKP